MTNTLRAKRMPGIGIGIDNAGIGLVCIGHAVRCAEHGPGRSSFGNTPKLLPRSAVHANGLTSRTSTSGARAVHACRCTLTAVHLHGIASKGRRRRPVPVILTKNEGIRRASESVFTGHWCSICRYAEWRRQAWPRAKSTKPPGKRSVQSSAGRAWCVAIAA